MNIEWATGAFAAAVYGAIAAAIFVGLVQWCWGSFQNRRGWLAGTWIQIIPAFEGREPRKDRVKCYHRGDRVTARITRLEPKEEKWKRWIFEGALRNDGINLVGIFLGLKGNGDSYGVILMRKVDINTFNGHYNRWLTRDDPIVPGAAILQRPQISLEWKRDK